MLCPCANREGKKNLKVKFVLKQKSKSLCVMDHFMVH